MNFSIIIPLYNKQDAVSRAIYSVAHQLRDNQELIIIDDGSSDNSLVKAKAIADEFPSKNIHVRSQRNAGVSAARNAGARYARGRYLCFLDADDSYESNFLDEVTRLTLEFPSAAMVATGYRLIKATTGSQHNAKISGLEQGIRRQLLADFFASATFGDLPVTSSSVCIKSTALKSIGGFPEDEGMGEDQSVWSQLALKFPIALSTKICANYFIHVSDSLMQGVAPSGEMPFSSRLNRLLTNGDIPVHLQKSVATYMAGHLFDLIRRNMLSGNVENARQLISDKRTRLLRKRWLYWSVRTRLGF